MKALIIGWGIMTLFVLFLKLFTYEFFLRDDPTNGIALRLNPSMVSQQILVETSSGTNRILLQDENAFVGNTLYRAFVGWGWITLLTVWLMLLGIAYWLSRTEKNRDHK